MVSSVCSTVAPMCGSISSLTRQGVGLVWEGGNAVVIPTTVGWVVVHSATCALLHTARRVCVVMTQL